jgi:hypothetical protein
LLVAEHRASGLVVARDAMDEASVTRALKALDGRLVLQKHPRDDAPGGWVYKVICVVSDTYAPVVFTWMDEHGNSLPLSHALVEAMQERMVGSRNKLPTSEEFNAQQKKRLERAADDIREEIIADHKPFLTRNRVGVLFSDAKLKRHRQGGPPRSGVDRG